MKFQKAVLAAVAGALTIVSSSALANKFPSNPMKIVAAFAPGSTTDNIARILANEFSKEFGVPVIVENRAGAQGVIGVQMTLAAPADGNTMTITSSSLNSSSPGLIKNLPYDPVGGFSHIGRIAVMPWMVLVASGSPAKNIKDLQASVKNGQSFFGYGSAGAQVAAEFFNTTVAVKATGVPYNGQPAAMTGLLGNQVQYMLADQSVSTGLLKAERVRALGVSTPQRLQQWPTVPTFAEQGFGSYNLEAWVGLGAPAGTPDDVVAKLNGALNRALAKPDVLEKLAGLGMVASPNTEKEQRQYVQDQLKNWGDRIKAAGIEPQ